jgi:thiosulfate/3-mercaptopyruvate sulfurtransferase
MYTTIVSTSLLHQNLGQPDWVVIDCRFDLQNPQWGFEDYQQAHIPGAAYAHLDNDLAAPVTPETGRHPLPDPEKMAERLGSWGVGSHSQVIVYDTSGGAYAARLWWQLRFLGHTNVAVLDGGFQKWQKEGRPVAQGQESHSPAVFTPTPQWQMIADVHTVDRIRADPEFLLIDARTPERYRGEREPIDPVAGHIPGAVNRFHGENLDMQGQFLSSNALHEQYVQLLGDTSSENVVAYCGSGVTSCHHLLAMEIAGLPGARLYPGSWSEWIRDPKRLKKP